MNPTQNTPPTRASVPGSSGALLDDPQVANAVEQYRAALAAGRRPDRAALLAQFPARHDALVECLDALDMLAAAAPGLRGTDTDPAADVLDEPLGDFRIVREAGRGGMGVVYEAVQESLNRRVALKVLPRAAALDQRQLHRFKNEAQAAALLHHPHIVPVYQVGSERGIHFYAMQFVEGRTLADIIAQLRGGPAGTPRRQTPPMSQSLEDTAPHTPGRRDAAEVIIDSPPAAPGSASDALAPTPTPMQNPTLVSGGGVQSSAYLREAARLGLQAAEGLEHAHQLGVVHRDIKPGNLMIDGRGELWITDFGLAQMQTDANLTASGDLLGTIRYMSPEQALAKRGIVDHRTDVYSLGATLYELVCLQPAYPGKDRQEVLRRIAFDEPVAPRRINPALPADLETIVLKAMAKIPTERYATAQELAEDLRRFLDDKPILARPPSLAVRVSRWARRHRSVVTTAIVALFLGIAGAMALLLERDARILGEQAETKKAKEETDAVNVKLGAALGRETDALQSKTSALDDLTKVRAQERQASYYHLIALAWREGEAGNPLRAVQFLQQAPQEHRSWEWQYLARLFHPELVARRAPPLFASTQIEDVLFGRDGEVLALSREERTYLRLRLVGATKRTNFLGWDVWTGQERFRRELELTRARLFSQDGQHAVWSGAKFDGAKVDGPEAKLVHVADLAGAAPPRTFSGHDGAITSMALDDSGKVLATMSTDKTIRLWQFPQGVEKQVIPTEMTGVVSLAFLANGKLLAKEISPSTIKLWDPVAGKVLHSIDKTNQASKRLPRVAWSRNGAFLALGSTDGNVAIWGTGEPSERLTFRAHDHAVSSLAFSPDGQYLATHGAPEHHVQVWHTATGKRRAQLSLAGEAIHGPEFSPDGLFLAARGANLLRIWDATFSDESGIPVELNRKSRVALNADGTQLAVTGTASIDLWDTRTRKLTASLPLDPFGNLPCLEFIRNTAQVVLTNVEGSRHFWDTETKKHVAGGVTDFESRLLAEPRGIMPIYHAMSRNGTRVALWKDGRVQVRDLLTDVEVLTLPHKNRVTLGFSPDGARLAVFDRTSKRVQIWNVSTRTLALDQALTTEATRALAFRPDGGQLAVLNQGDTVGVIDVASGEHRELLRWPASGLHCLEFSPDGKRLLAGVDRKLQKEGAVLVFDAATGHEVATLPLPFPVRELRFSANGRCLVVTDKQRALRVLETGDVSALDRKDLILARRASWHMAEAGRCEAAGNVDGARWHRERIKE